MTHQFKLPIGDWSDDGHGKCDYYLIRSNKSVEEVREIHFSIPDNLGVNIEKICRGYEESKMSSDIAEELVELGWECSKDYMDSESMCRLWVFLLMKTDPTLELEVQEENIEMLPFYGFDEKKRHIGFVGYGVFN